MLPAFYSAVLHNKIKCIEQDCLVLHSYLLSTAMYQINLKVVAVLQCALLTAVADSSDAVVATLYLTQHSTGTYPHCDGNGQIL